MRIPFRHMIVLRMVFSMCVVLMLPVCTYGYSQGTYYAESTYYGYSESTYYGYGQGTYYGYGYSQGGYSFTLTKSSTVTGTLNVTGTLSKGSGTFAIDHPLDPKNTLLYHSFVESPDVKNIYDGVAELDENGEAVIELPAYFFALNNDFRYLTTAIGQPMPDLHIASGARRRYVVFGTPVVIIAGGSPGGRVSWQVTGIRHDPFILANPIVPEVEKGPEALVEQGEYLFPEYYEK